MKTNKLSSENETANCINTLLAAGFRSKLEQMKFAKLLSYATIYHQDPEWEEGVYMMSKDFAEKEVFKLKIPDGWQAFSTYETLKAWFFQACR